jgi:hypothetical protein
LDVDRPLRRKTTAANRQRTIEAAYPACKEAWTARKEDSAVDDHRSLRQSHVKILAV